MSESPAAASRPSSAPVRRLLSRLMLAVMLLTGLWIAWQEAPREVGRWYLAAAVEHRLNAEYCQIEGRTKEAQGFRDRAESALLQALKWYADGGEIYFQRAQWRERDGQYAAALADCQSAAKLGVSELAIAPLKASVLMHMGRENDAVQEAEKIHAAARATRNPDDDANGLNAVAYFRALAGENLAQALDEVDDALRRVPQGKVHSEILDTRGFVLYQMGRYEEAMQVFKTVLPRIDAELAALRTGRPSERVLSQRDYAVARERAIEPLAVIYYHAALVQEKLNRGKEADELRSKAREILGREPDASVF